MRMRMRKGARKRESSACGFCVEQKLRRYGLGVPLAREDGRRTRWYLY